jgi:hypothetical protein
MKRFLSSSLLVVGLCVSGLTSWAGGHGCGWHGGGCYGGHGCYYGHGYYGGGYYGPVFSFGIGFGGYYPSYGYAAYGYPAYSYPAYAYAPAATVYAQPTATVAVTASSNMRPATSSAYVYSNPAAAPAAQKYYTPAPIKPAAVAATALAPEVASSKPTSGKWVLDAHPYSYTPSASGSSAGTAGYAATR